LCALIKIVQFIIATEEKMGEAFTEPSGFPSMPGHRLGDMYTRVGIAEKKKAVLESFCTNGGNLKLNCFLEWA